MTARAAVAVLVVLLTAAGSAGAEVRRVLVSTRQEVLGGDYEKLGGTVELELDPTHPANAAIVDLDRAPRNAQGLVEAIADVEILRPTIAANGNRRLIYDVVNRGTQRALSYFNDASRGTVLPRRAMLETAS